jgi:hypothetical protein
LKFSERVNGAGYLGLGEKKKAKNAKNEIDPPLF